MNRIIVAGDMCPVGRNEHLFSEGDADLLLDDFTTEFEAADLVVANLECPLIETESPIEKVGPNLGAPVACARGLQAVGVDVAVLANNHIMDHGPSGLRSTMEALDRHAIQYAGAGTNLREARAICIRDVGEHRIGILAMAEREFGIAGVNTPGVNPLDVIDFVRNSAAHRAEYDYLIVMLHGGNEYYPYPRPRLQDTCRFLVEQGAAAVICQHTHCVGCMETYEGAPILYGQGNFIFDWDSPHESFYEGVLAVLEIEADRRLALTLKPFAQAGPAAGIRRMTSGQQSRFTQALNQRSSLLLDRSALEEEWRHFWEQRRRYYLGTLYGKSTLLCRLAVKVGLLNYRSSQSVLLQRLNCLRCESHREALIDILSAEARE